MFANVVRVAVLIAALAVPAALASDHAESSTCDVKQWTLPIGCNDHHMFPGAADLSRARLLTFRDLPRWAPAIFVAPAGKRGMCFASVTKPYTLTSEWEIVQDRDEAEQDHLWGCERDEGPGWGWTLSESIYPRHFYGSAPDRKRAGVWLVSSVEAGIARVKLVFQDGFTATTRPQARVVAYSISQPHWRAGHRLVRAVLYDAKGREVRRAHWNPKLEGPFPKAGCPVLHEGYLPRGGRGYSSGTHRRPSVTDGGSFPRSFVVQPGLYIEFSLLDL